MEFFYTITNSIPTMESTENDNWILNHLKKFNSKSLPVFSSEFAQGISLKKIHEIESVDNKPITLIAVTRNQPNNNNFNEYSNYIKDILEFDRVYFGLWHDGNRIEHDVLYVLPTDNYHDVQVNLNMHNHLNGGLAQVMALTIFPDGSAKAVMNTIFNAF